MKDESSRFPIWLGVGELYVMHTIEVRDWEEGSVLVELGGEFDWHNLEHLREILDDVSTMRRPTMVDLSEVTFLDVDATCELTIRSRLYDHHLTLCNPSPEVRASVTACGFEEWFEFRYDPEDPSCSHASPERAPAQ
jgi:anti-anti-sigma factor